MLGASIGCLSQWLQADFSIQAGSSNSCSARCYEMSEISKPPSNIIEQLSAAQARSLQRVSNSQGVQ